MMNAMEVTDAERAMIEERRTTERIEWKPRLEEDYQEWEKAEAFGRLHAMAMVEFQRRIEAGGCCDAEQYVFEAVMELLGKGVWGVLNAL